MPEETGFQRLISANARLLKVYSVSREFAATGRPLLLVGEAGTGRRALAQALSEHAGSPAPLYVRDDPGLSLDDLRQYPSDAFVLVRNTSELSLETQKDLAAVLTGDSPVAAGLPHLVFSASPDLPLKISSGRFLPELYYSLSACEARLPPLRERDGDMPVLIEYFVRGITEALARPRVRTSVGFLDVMSAYPFPGNVSELKMLMHKAVFWAQDDRLSEGEARTTLENHAINRIATQIVEGRQEPLRQILFPAQLPTAADAKRQLILEALRRADGNQSQAARALGLTPPAINKFLIRHENQS